MSLERGSKPNPEKMIPKEEMEMYAIFPFVKLKISKEMRKHMKKSHSKRFRQHRKKVCRLELYNQGE